MDACIDGDLLKVQKALASGKLSAEDLDTGLSLATSNAHPDIVAAFFHAGVPISSSAVNGLRGGEEGY